MAIELSVEPLDLSGDIIGVRGESVYDIALRNGYTGTEAEFIESLKGDPGHTPQKGVDYADGQDGVSPTVSVTDISRGHRVTITDGTGDHTFDVFDGVVDVSGSGVAITVDSSGIMHFNETEGN